MNALGAIIPAAVAASVGAIVTSSVGVAAVAGGIVAAIAVTAAIVGRGERDADPQRALRGALIALAVRLVGGLALVVAAARFVPASATLIACIAGAGLAGAALVNAAALMARREATRA